MLNEIQFIFPDFFIIIVIVDFIVLESIRELRVFGFLVKEARVNSSQITIFVVYAFCAYFLHLSHLHKSLYISIEHII